MTSILTPATRGDMSVRAARPRAHRGRATRVQRRWGWAMVTPAIVHNTIFFALPVIMMIILGFTNYSLLGQTKWIGLRNYHDLIKDPVFRTALVNTVLYTLAVVPVAMAIAIVLAVALNQDIRGRAVYRTLYYVPVVTATVAVATVWKWIYEPDVGVANALLGLVGIGPVRWLTSTTSALPAIMIVGVWQGLGTKIVVYLAALQGVNRSLIEAARIDGASRWAVFRHVTWRALGPAHFFVLITSLIQSFQVFDQVYIMTQGGPVNATRVLTFDVYTNAFQKLSLGYASAESVVMFLIIVIFVAVGARVLRRSNEQ